MTDNAFFLTIYLIFALIVYFFFYFSVKGLFHAENTLITLGLRDKDILTKIKGSKKNKVSLSYFINLHNSKEVN